jgi:hypothetical protein
MRVPVSHICQTGVVPEFCTCGAQLPPDARFCHKCGKPQYDYPGLEEPEPTPPPAEALSLPPATYVQLSGEITFHNRLAVRIGFIAAMGAVMISVFPIPWPFVRLPIAFLLAGFLAVYLYSRRTGQTLSIRSGARMGWITGIFSSQGDFAKQLLSQLPANDARADMIQQALSNPALILGVVVLYLLLFFVIFTALPIIGGALGAKVLEKE